MIADLCDEKVDVDALLLADPVGSILGLCVHIHVCVQIDGKVRRRAYFLHFCLPEPHVSIGAA